MRRSGRALTSAVNHDSRHFEEDLEELKQRLLAMGALAESRLQMAMDGLVERNHALLAEVVSGDTTLNDLQIEIDDRCFTLIALQQPVAVDLRVIVSAMKINVDLERVGDLAVNVGQAAQSYLRHPPVKPLIDLPRMGDLALKMLREAIGGCVSRDIGAAHAVLQQDDLLDALKDQVFRELLTHMLGDPSTIEPGVDLVLISRHLERVGDHATNIAEDVIFIEDGRDVRHGLVHPILKRRRSDTTPI
jgi:phosphate transport system protein